VEEGAAEEEQEIMVGLVACPVAEVEMRQTLVIVEATVVAAG
jgi:hypothetical protein